MEELVAELGAAFVCADLQLSPTPAETDDAQHAHLEHHASYIASWLDVLKRDNRAVFTAASHAQRAADYLGALQPDAGHAAQPETDAA